jgi:large subunit ribosomal protein L10
MNREQKGIIIDSIKGDFSNSGASFVVGYKGLTVHQMQTLRKELRAKNGTFKVAKGRLIKLATQGLEGADKLAPYFKEQIGVVFAQGEMPAVAKVLFDFAKQNSNLKLVAGFFDAQVMPSADVERIATLPSREVLLAQACFTAKFPIQRLVWTLQAIVDAKKGQE